LIPAPLVQTVLFALWLDVAGAGADTGGAALFFLAYGLKMAFGFAADDLNALAEDGGPGLLLAGLQ